ncbi:nucleoside hydrolase-like domain-containing protein [uncultured Draconibacterium sp.]|uniref:nucleoside hydrolase-like domain-containing protein n=1 Tax=uncultured Draconibacterium sp. TaxID=1573823 RepID=UPI0032170B0D
MKKIIFALTYAFAISFNILANQPVKPRVIAMTDGEVDDRCSMVRFLLYTNDMNLEAIIQTNSVYQLKGWSSEKWIEQQIDAYEQVYPNLKIHDSAYPSPDYIRSKLFIGDEESTHVVVDHDAPLRIPGVEPVIDPANWADTPGSDKIVEILLEDDPRLVYIQAWGGGNTAARAFYKLKTQYPADYKRAVSKVVMYNIWYQDGAGSYIEKYHPGVIMLLSHYFSGTWDYGSQRYTKPFVTEYLHNNHGPLAALYPQDYISEGDSPAFLYILGNGLRGYENPTWGGWGGRFYKVDGFENVYRDIDKGSFLRWIEYANRDFEARLKWCVADKYEDANHKPNIKIVGELDRTVKSGELVEIEAEINDPDPVDLEALWEKMGPIVQQRGYDKSILPALAARQPKFSPLWWQYVEAGSYQGNIKLSDPAQNKVQLVAPKVNKPETIHLILEAKDGGSPGLTAFSRVVITVMPE